MPSISLDVAPAFPSSGINLPDSPKYSLALSANTTKPDSKNEMSYHPIDRNSVIPPSAAKNLRTQLENTVQNFNKEMKQRFGNAFPFLESKNGKVTDASIKALLKVMGERAGPTPLENANFATPIQLLLRAAQSIAEVDRVLDKPSDYPQLNQRDHLKDVLRDANDSIAAAHAGGLSLPVGVDD